MRIFKKKPLIWSLILFALSAVIGIIPLVFSLIHYHLQLSADSKNQLKADKLEKSVVLLLVIGYILFIAIFISILIYLALYR